MDQLFSTLTGHGPSLMTPLAVVGIVISAVVVAVGLYCTIRWLEPYALLPTIFVPILVLAFTVAAPHDYAQRDERVQALATYVQDRYDVVPVESALFDFDRHQGQARFRALDEDGETAYVTAVWSTDHLEPIVDGTKLPTPKNPVKFTIDEHRPADWR